MNRRIKRGTALIAAMAAAVTMTGCGSTSATSDNGPDMSTDNNSFHVFSAISALSSGYDDSEILNEMADEAGVNIEWEALSDSISEQVNIRIAGDQLPDAFQGIGFSNYDISRYGDDGTLIDLTPYINEEIMPNLTKILEENPKIRQAITMSDGKIYGLPSAEQMGTVAVGDENDFSIFSVPQFSMINKAWLDALGLEVPTTLDELHDCLVAFKENDMSHTYYGNAVGSTIPMSTGFDQWCWGQNIFYAGFGFTNWPNDVCDDLVVQNGKVDFVSDNDNYRAAIAYFHDWYAEGLIDPEFFSQNDTQLIAKCSQGEVGVSTWWYIEELMGDYADDYVYLPFLAGPDGTYSVTLRSGGATNSGQLSITKACKSPANLLRFYDLWYLPENVMQLQYGPIGTFFQEKDADGLWMSITDEEARAQYGKSAGELKSSLEVAGPKLILSSYYRTTFEMEERATERLENLRDFWLPLVSDTESYPLDVVYTDDELDSIDLYKTDLQNTISEYEGKWLKDGAPTDEEWEEYKEFIQNRCGMNELQGVYQEAYDRYLSGQSGDEMD